MTSGKKYIELLTGFKQFQKEYQASQNDSYRTKAATGQFAKVMIISCCDARANPSKITKAALGEIFILSNVANIVPPYQTQDKKHNSTAAAIEFAVKHLEVEDIIIMGHSNCGGIKTLMSCADNEIYEDCAAGAESSHQSYGRKEISKVSKFKFREITKEYYSYILPWVTNLAKAKSLANKEKNLTDEQKLKICEKQGIVISLSNLKTFPFVSDAIKSGKLNIHGWYFEIQTGCLYEYSYNKDQFIAI